MPAQAMPPGEILRMLESLDSKVKVVGMLLPASFCAVADRAKALPNCSEIEGDGVRVIDVGLVEGPAGRCPPQAESPEIAMMEVKLATTAHN